ncbi:hypothetical protein J6590_065455, partial [Homalodisca vitripennis]
KRFRKIELLFLVRWARSFSTRALFKPVAFTWAGRRSPLQRVCEFYVLEDLWRLSWSVCLVIGIASYLKD